MLATRIQSNGFVTQSFLPVAVRTACRVILNRLSVLATCFLLSRNAFYDAIAMTVLTTRAGRVALRRVGYAGQQFLSPVKKRQRSRAVSGGNGITTGKEGKTIPTPNIVSPLPLWQRLGPLSIMFNSYARAQRKRPYITQFCSSLVIYFCGDLAAQQIAGEKYNIWRTLRSLVIGGISSIPSYKW